MRTSIAKPSRLASLRAALVAFLVALSALSATAFEMRLEDDRIWLQARNLELLDLMERFAHLGVEVEMDPTISDRINARVTAANLEATLTDLLSDYAYVLIWDVLEGPLGRMSRLAGIRLFRPGQSEAAETIFAEQDQFRVARAGDGSGLEFIADEIIIGFVPGSNPHAVRRLIHEIGGTIVEGLPELGIYRIRLPPGTNILALNERLNRNPLVAVSEPNYVYRLPDLPSGDRRLAAEVGMARSPVSGASPIAVLDSGITLIEGLERFVVGGYNALQPDRDPTDTAGHGTQMALIASGAVVPHGAADGDGMPVLAIRSFDDAGVTSNFAMMRSILHAASEGAGVLNMSWGSTVNSEFMASTIGAAQENDLIVVAAAGNDGQGVPMYPAAYDGVVAVGAALPDGQPWPMSNYGDHILIAAPGQASFPVGYGGEPGAYAGTSIASAHAAHALGRYRAEHPAATADEAVAALIRAVEAEEEEAGRDPFLGHGVLTPAALERYLRHNP